MGSFSLDPGNEDIRTNPRVERKLFGAVKKELRVEETVIPLFQPEWLDLDDKMVRILEGYWDGGLITAIF